MLAGRDSIEDAESRRAGRRAALHAQQIRAGAIDRQALVDQQLAARQVDRAPDVAANVMVLPAQTLAMTSRSESVPLSLLLLTIRLMVLQPGSGRPALRRRRCRCRPRPRIGDGRAVNRAREAALIGVEPKEWPFSMAGLPDSQRESVGRPAVRRQKRGEHRIDIELIAGGRADDRRSGGVADQVVALRGEHAVEVRVGSSRILGDDGVFRIQCRAIDEVVDAAADDRRVA